MERLSGQIRRAVRRSGFSHYRICFETRLDTGQFSRFMTGKRGLSLEALDRLADFLGLRIIDGRSKRRTKR